MKNKEFRDFLNKMIANKRSKMEELQRKSDASNDLNEVRSIGKTLQALRDEIADVEDQLKKLDESEGDDNGDDNGSDNGGNNGGNNGDDNGDDNKEGRSGAPKGTELRNGFVKVGSFGYGKEKRSEETDRHDTVAYRKAFMEYVCRGTQIPAELRKDEVTGTTDAAAVIPTTILGEIIQKLETYGNVYKLVRKLNVQGGVAIPILSLKPEGKWVGEGSSESQKVEANEKVTFLYYGVECKIAQTLLASVVTLEAFQQLFVQLRRGVEHLAESDAQPRQQQAQQQYPEKGFRRRVGVVGQHKCGGGQPHAAADPDADQCRDQAGQQRGILHGADVDDFQRENRCSQRRAEHRRKRTRHAAHRH